MKRWITVLIIAAFLAENGFMPVARAQEEDLDRLFEEDPIEEPPPFGEPPPAGDFDEPPPGAGVPPGNTFNPPPTPPSSGGFRPPPTSAAGGSGNVPALKSTGDLKERFSKANIEDITNENFPETIESFDFPNADIKDVIKAISELTGKNFIIESSINGRVTIMAPSKITVAEAYKAFLSALAGIGFTVVPSGKFLKIKSIRNAQKDAIETYSGPYFPNADMLVTRIVQMKHTSAAEIDRKLKSVISKEGELTAYEPTNSLIITDFGSSIERTMRIINEIDKPGFEETLEVLPLKYAKASDIAEMLNQIINKEAGGGGGAGGFGRPGVPRFGSRARTGAASGAPEELSLVAPDERTNAIIVLGTKAGIDKVKSVVRKLDYRLNPEEAGGVFVYYVKHGEAEKIQAVLQGVSQGAAAGGGGGGAGGAAGGAPSATRPFNPTGGGAVFGGDVKIQADKVTNSLVIVASKPDYDIVRNILNQIDIPRDQVYVEAYIVEMTADKTRDWNPAVYYFKDTGNADSNALARSGFSRAGTLSNILNPASDQGAILGFGSGKTLSIKLGTTELTVPSLIGFINFLQTNANANVLSTPQILALDNEQASIEVGENVPVEERSTTGTGIQNSTPRYEKVTMKLELTPFISPDSEAVRMKLKQTIKGRANATVSGSGGAVFPIFTDRGIDSNIVVNSGDTAVLGGLVRDEEQVTETKVPLLGDVPVLGWLFKSNRKEKRKLNLLIFLTPKIIRTQEENQQQVSKKLNERIDWMKENTDGRDPFGKKIDSMPRAASKGRNPSSRKR